MLSACAKCTHRTGVCMSGANRGANGLLSLTTQVCSIQHLIQHSLGASLDSTVGGVPDRTTEALRNTKPAHCRGKTVIDLLPKHLVERPARRRHRRGCGEDPLDPFFRGLRPHRRERYSQIERSTSWRARRWRGCRWHGARSVAEWAPTPAGWVRSRRWKGIPRHDGYGRDLLASGRFSPGGFRRDSAA